MHPVLLRSARLVIACLTLIAASRAVTLPDGGTTLFSGDLPSAFTFGANADQAQRTTVAVSGPPASQGWRISNLKDAKNPWDVELSAPLSRAFTQGDLGVVVFWARATRTPKDTLLGTGRLSVHLQKAAPNWDKSLTQTVQVGAEWKEYAFRFKWMASYASSGAMVAFDFGFAEQDIEIAAIQVHHFGTTVALSALPNTVIGYPGMEDGAAWRTAALARIETLRKGDITVHVTDTDGNPVPDADVSIELIRHAFPFGCVFHSDLVTQDDTAEGRAYRRKFLELFNSGSPENDLKWQPWAGDWGSAWSHELAGAGLDWAVANQLPARGHVMVWPGKSNLPKAIADLIGTGQQSTIPAKVISRIDEISAFSSGKVYEWDVVNEPFDNHDLLDAFGSDIMVDWFKRAKEKIPTARLYLNDWGNHDMFADPAHVQFDIDTVRNLQAKGAPIEGLGIQAHVGSAPAAPVHLLATLDRLATETTLPLRITEFDSEIDDETVQGNYMRDFLIATFSHASVNGVQLWGFWEKAHWLPKGALYRADFSEKPSGKAFRDWVHGTWKTHIEGKTSASGVIGGRGFQGDYVVTVRHAGQVSQQRFTLTPGSSANVTLSTKSPRLVNISTRGLAGGTYGPLTVGIVIPAGSAKQVLIRGVGPAMRKSPFNVSTALTSTMLTVHRIVPNQPAVVIASNRGWSNGNDSDLMAAAFATAGAFPLSANSADSALALTLDPGNYTFDCTSTDGTSGVALVEAYELTITPNAFYNLSTLGYTGPGEGVLISGFVVTGDNARTFLVRAAGPKLSFFGVGGVNPRPVITVYDGRHPIAMNNGWESSPDRDLLAATATSAGAFAFDDGSADASLRLTLKPGPYTAVVSGAQGAKGVVLIEMYEVRIP